MANCFAPTVQIVAPFDPTNFTILEEIGWDDEDEVEEEETGMEVEVKPGIAPRRQSATTDPYAMLFLGTSSICRQSASI